MTTIKSELRKLFSVRSTYVVSAMAFIIVAFASWVTVREFKQEMKNMEELTAQVSQPAEVPAGANQEEAKSAQAEMAQAVADFEERKTTRLRELLTNSVGIATIFACIIAILQVVHEYRWNVIMHTLTASRSRTKVFLSKVGILLVFSLFLGLIASFVCLVAYKFTVSAYDVSMPAQTVEWGTVALRCATYMATFISFPLIIAFISRNLVLAVVSFLVIPSTIEPLLGLLLKSKAIYLPFAAQNHIILFNKQNPPESLDFSHALMVTLIYLAILYPLTWFLFLKRDAN